MDPNDDTPDLPRWPPSAELDAVLAVITGDGSGLQVREILGRSNLSSLAVIPALDELIDLGAVQRKAVSVDGTTCWHYFPTASGARLARTSRVV